MDERTVARSIPEPVAARLNDGLREKKLDPSYASPASDPKLRKHWDLMVETDHRGFVDPECRSPVLGDRGSRSLCGHRLDEQPWMNRTK
jgi:hypothetical protein